MWWLGPMLIGMHLGLHYLEIKEKLSEIIRRSNLRQLVERILSKSPERKAKELLSKQIEIAVKNKNGNTISIDVLESLGKGTRTVEAKIELTGTAVAEDVYVGLEV